MKTVFQFGGPNPYNGAATDSLITLEQKDTESALFVVTYGLQRKTNLTYSQAAKELGDCIFHHLACESVLDNGGE